MIVHGDCLEKLKLMDENSVDAIVTDPPYGLSFMGKKWDADVPSVELWREVLRVLKPGGHVLSFCGTRTYHRMVVNMEDAGFEVRDTLAWHTGSGFPKSLDVHKSAMKAQLICGCTEANSQHGMRSLQCSDLSSTIDIENQPGQVLQSCVSEQSPLKQGCAWTEPKASGREEPGMEGRELYRTTEGLSNDSNAFASESEAEWVCAGTHTGGREDVRSVSDKDGGDSSYQSQSCGQSAREFENLCRSQVALDGSPFPRCAICSKPILPKGLGTALKPATELICLARKPLERGLTVASNVLKHGTGGLNIDASRIGYANDKDAKEGRSARASTSKGMEFFSEGEHDQFDRSNRDAIQGRWPANVIFGCACDGAIHDQMCAVHLLDEQSGDCKSGGASTGRGFQDELVGGGVQNKTKLDSYKKDSGIGASRFFYVAKASKRERNAGLDVNKTNGHPTVKPLRLMQYLCKLITPPKGIILDPFCGSGSTGVAAKNLGFQFIGIEMNEEYVEIAKRRINE